MMFNSAAQSGFYREGTTPERVQGKMVTAGDHLFVNAVSLEATDAGLSNIYRYDASGNSIRFTTGKYVWNMLPITGNRLLLLSEERRCTFNPDTLDFFIETITADGALLSSLKVDDGVSCIVQTPDSSFLAFLWDNKTLLRVDKSGASYTAVTHTLGPVWDALLCSNGKIAVSHNPGSGERLSQIDKDGTVNFTRAAPSTLSRLRPLGTDRITSFSQVTMYVFDLNLDLVSATVLPFISDYYFFNDSLFSLMRKDDKKDFYYTVLDKDFKIVSQKSFSPYQPLFLTRYSEYSAVINEPVTFSKGWLGHYLAVIPRNSVPVLSRNISLSSGVDSAYIVARGDGFYDVYARVKHNVSATGKGVQKFSITTELSPGKDCGVSYHTASYNLPVVAGKALQIKEDTFLRQTGKFFNGAVNVQYCSVAARPDDEFDGVLFNNLSCVMVSFDPTDIPEMGRTQIAWSVAPNPGADRMMLSASEPIGYYSIHDLQGRELLSAECNAVRYEIDVAALPAGLYLLKISAGDKRSVKKFVKL